MKQGEQRENNQRFYWGLSYASGYFHLGMLSEATQELKNLGIEYQKHPEVLSLNGLILLARRRWQDVVEHSELATSLYPESPDFYIQAAYAYDKLNMPAEARDIWLEAPQEVRTSPLFHYNIARCEARLGNHDTAKKHVKTALTLAPEMITAIHEDPNLQHLLEDEHPLSSTKDESPDPT